MRVWNKKLPDLTGKDLFKLYFLFTIYKGINKGFIYSRTGQILQKKLDQKREENTIAE